MKRGCFLIVDAVLLRCPMADPNSAAHTTQTRLRQSLEISFLWVSSRNLPLSFLSFENIWYGYVSHASEILGWCFQGLEVWHNLTGLLVYRSCIARRGISSDLCAMSVELPILWAMLMALLSLLVALPTKKNKTFVNSQIRSFSLCFLIRSVAITGYSTDCSKSWRIY